MVAILLSAIVGGALGAVLSRPILRWGRTLDTGRVLRARKRAALALIPVVVLSAVNALAHLYSLPYAELLVLGMVLAAAAAMLLARRIPNAGWRLAGDLAAAALFLLVLASEAFLANGSAGGPAARLPQFNHYAFGPRSVPALQAGARSGDRDSRLAAITELSSFRGQSAAAMIPVLADPDPIVRAAAVRFVTGLKDPRLVDPLCARVFDPDPQVRAAATAAVEQVEDPRGTTVLLASAAAASEGADRPGTSQPLDLEFTNRLLNRPPAWLLDSIRTCIRGGAGPHAGEEGMRAKAVMVAGHAHDSEMEEPLREALRDRSARVRAAAAAGLAEFALGARKAEAMVLLNLEQPMGAVAVSSTDNNFQVNTADVVAALRAALLDSAPEVRLAAVEGLARLVKPVYLWGGRTLNVRDPDSRMPAVSVAGMGPTLIPLLRDPEPRARAAAAVVLGFTGDARAIPALQQADRPLSRFGACPYCTALFRLGMRKGLRHRVRPLSEENASF